MKLTALEVNLSQCRLENSKIDSEVIKLFQKIKSQCLKSSSSTYEGVLTHLFYCIKLFNSCKIDSKQLINSVKNLFGYNFPHLYYEFLQIVEKIQNETLDSENKNKTLKCLNMDSSAYGFRRDISFIYVNDCGPSYRMLPADYNHKLCSGRLNKQLCYECLNDNYICFPSMTSEDTSVVSSKKNIHEEQMHRLEDERYEVDMFQEINKYALKHLIDINKKMESMTKDEKLKFQLDDHVGGSSAILMRKAIYRIYGDATDNMIEGLKVRPKMAIPLVISRMQEKAKEWNQIHSKFKMVWEDRANKHYWQSLDYQGDWTKRDAVFLKRSTFFSQIESLSKSFTSLRPEFFNSDFIKVLSKTKNHFCYDRMAHAQAFPRGIYGNISELSLSNGVEVGPHLSLYFPTDSETNSRNMNVSMKEIIENATILIVNCINIQSNLSKEDKQVLCEYINQIIGHFFCGSGIEISFLNDSLKDHRERKTDRNVTSPLDRKTKHKRLNSEEIDDLINEKNAKTHQSSPKKLRLYNSEESSKPLKYSFMIGNSYMYTFIRLYHVLIDRLTVLKIHSSKLIQEDSENITCSDDSSNEENDRYSKVLKLLLDSNESNPDNTINNDNKIRMLFTTKAFLWFTVPRIVYQIVKISQQILCAGLESSKDFLDMYYHHSINWPSGTSGSFMNREMYYPRERKYANDVMDFCSHQGLCCFFLIYIRQEGRLLIQMIDSSNMKNSNESSNTLSDCGSPFLSDILKPCFEEATGRIMISDEKPMNYISYVNKFCLINSGKKYPLFLMKNLKRGVRTLINQSLEHSKHEAIKRSFPAMEEITFMKTKIYSKMKSEEIINVPSYLNIQLKELCRNVFIGNGEIYNYVFERNSNRIERNGFLLKKNVFSKKTTLATKKEPLEEILNSIKKCS